MNNKMTFVRNEKGNLEIFKPIINVEVADDFKPKPFGLCWILDVPKIVKKIKKTEHEIITFNYFENKALSLTLGATALVSKSVFWSAFLTYLFPWFLDVGKVYCAIKIAQAFYQEKRGGGDKTGWETMIGYGKWYLFFWAIPIFVEFIDKMGSEIYEDIRAKDLMKIK